MSKTGTKALQNVLKRIETMSDKELLEIFEIAAIRQKKYEEDLNKFNSE